jgi:hypothetical protein
MSITQADKAKKFRALHKLPKKLGAHIAVVAPSGLLLFRPGRYAPPADELLP